MSDYKIAAIQIGYHLDGEGDVTKIEFASNFGADAGDFSPLLREALAQLASNEEEGLTNREEMLVEGREHQKTKPDTPTDITNALDALQAVLEMHVAPDWVKVQRPNDRSRDICQECTTEDTMVVYPCRTVLAIQEALGEAK